MLESYLRKLEVWFWIITVRQVVYRYSWKANQLWVERCQKHQRRLRTCAVRKDCGQWAADPQKAYDFITQDLQSRQVGVEEMFWVEDPTMCLVCMQRRRWVLQMCSYDLVVKFFRYGIYNNFDGCSVHELHCSIHVKGACLGSKFAKHQLCTPFFLPLVLCPALHVWLP